MDNVTHAFVGAAIGECVAPTGATARTRALLMGVGIVAANAPDIDLVYSNIIEEPLGYLLHHRGHSHTWPGLAALGLLIWGGLRLFPRTREEARGSKSRWLLLLAAALASHLVMDTANGYGAHLFYPLSSRWVYGDSVFVLEPWLWAILGATLALNAGRFWRVTIALLTLSLIGTLAYMTLLPTVVAALILVVVTAAAVAVRAWDRKQRAAFVLLGTAAIFLTMAGVSRAAKAEARRTVAGARRRGSHRHRRGRQSRHSVVLGGADAREGQPRSARDTRSAPWDGVAAALAVVRLGVCLGSIERQSMVNRSAGNRRHGVASPVDD